MSYITLCKKYHQLYLFVNITIFILLFIFIYGNTYCNKKLHQYLNHITDVLNIILYTSLDNIKNNKYI